MSYTLQVAYKMTLASMYTDFKYKSTVHLETTSMEYTIESMCSLQAFMFPCDHQRQHLLELFREGKAPLVEPAVPGALIYRDLMQEKARIRANIRRRSTVHIKERSRVAKQVCVSLFAFVLVSTLLLLLSLLSMLAMPPLLSSSSYLSESHHRSHCRNYPFRHSHCHAFVNMNINMSINMPIT